jgi:hypothetical protein
LGNLDLFRGRFLSCEQRPWPRETEMLTDVIKDLVNSLDIILQLLGISIARVSFISGKGYLSIKDPLDLLY